METPNRRNWSELHHDLLESIFKRLSFTDFHRAKIVCSNWNSSSKLTFPKKTISPWLMLSPEEEDKDVSVQLYNTEEDRIYRSKRDFSKIRFLANSGKWFLVIDSQSNLYIIDLFSENRINLPLLESIQASENCTLKILGDDKSFRKVIINQEGEKTTTFPISDSVKGVLWVDEETQDYIVVWFFDFYANNCVFFCKNGDDHHHYIPLLSGVLTFLQNISDVVLCQGHSLYILTDHDYIRVIDLSGPRGCFRDVSWSNPFDHPSPCQYKADCSIVVVNISGEVLLVQSIVEKDSRGFRVFKRNPDTDSDQYYIEVDSLGDEALLLGLRITVPCIEPNSIYFTTHDSVCRRVRKPLNMSDICVFNLVTRTLKRFPSLSNMKLKDSRWFLSDT